MKVPLAPLLPDTSISTPQGGGGLSSCLRPLQCLLSLCCVQIPAGGVAYPRSHYSTAGRNAALKRSQTSAPGDTFLFLYLHLHIYFYISCRCPYVFYIYIERHSHLPKLYSTITHAHGAASIYIYTYISIFLYVSKSICARNAVSLSSANCPEIVVLQRSSPRVVSLHPVRNTPPVLLLAFPSFPFFSALGRGFCLLAPCNCLGRIRPSPSLLSKVLSPHNANLGVLAEPQRSSTVTRSTPPSVPSAGGMPMRPSCVCVS